MYGCVQREQHPHVNGFTISYRAVEREAKQTLEVSRTGSIAAKKVQLKGWKALTYYTVHFTRLAVYKAASTQLV